jgi:hypothetical protein
MLYTLYTLKWFLIQGNTTPPHVIKSLCVTLSFCTKKIATRVVFKLLHQLLSMEMKSSKPGALQDWEKYARKI